MTDKETLEETQITSSDDQEIEESFSERSPTYRDPQLIAASMYSGPLPSPQVLKAYGLVQPGLDVKIVDLLIGQTTHRQKLESTVIIGDGNRAWAGIACAFVLSLTTILGGIYLVDKGNKLAGTVISVGSLASLSGVFIYGTNQRKDERRKKRENLLKSQQTETEG